MNTLALLCERCGYTIDHLPTTGACPECGDAISHSLPTARLGSPFQQRRSILTWATTNWKVMRHPKALFRSLRLQRGGTTPFLLTNLFIAGMFMVDPWVSVFIGDPARAARNAPPLQFLLIYGASWLAEVSVGALILLLLTRLEWYGMRFIAARRGWRLTADAAWQVCSHASVGWIFVGLVPFLAMALLYIFANWFGLTPHGMLSVPPITSRPVPWTNVVNFGVIGLGFLAGMLVFETLVYLGVRQCRFGNPPRPSSGAQIDAPAAPDSVPAHSQREPV